ncbi:MAG: erythromycin esterase family protein [Bacteroidota bacterium]
MKKSTLLIISLFYAGITFGQIVIQNVPYTEDNYSDLNFLEKELAGKRIVCLGEEWHFTETFSQIKNRIVKYLHQELGYNVIIFESSFQGALIAQTENLKNRGRLFETVQTIWRTESVLDLMRYISKSTGKSNPIQQYGIDLYGTYTDQFKLKLEGFLELNYPDLKSEILTIDSKIQEDYLAKHRGKKKFKSRVTLKEIEQYKELLSRIENADNSSDYIFDKPFLSKAIENRILLGESLISNDFYFREKVMSDNIAWILGRLSENDKVIIWAADIHISKAQKKTVADGDRSMIERLPANIKEAVYSLSLIPIESTPKKVKKELMSRAERFFFYQLNENEDQIKRGDEFDGMIVCKDVESIENYKIEH